MSKDKEKETILAAAQEVFSRKGAHAATIEEVAKESKIDLKKVKSIYANVDAILEESIEREIEESSELFTKVINDRGKADIKLTRLVRELLTRYQHSYVLFNVISIAMENIDECNSFLKDKLKQEHLDRFRQNTAIIGRLIAQGQSEGLFTDIDPLEAAYLLRGMISAALRYRKITNREDDMRDHADTIMRVFLKGLLR